MVDELCSVTDSRSKYSGGDSRTGYQCDRAAEAEVNPIAFAGLGFGEQMISDY